eukprot:12515877-Prorocentrum_lima.AAC.1
MEANTDQGGHGHGQVPQQGQHPTEEQIQGQQQGLAEHHPHTPPPPAPPPPSSRQLEQAPTTP